VPDAVPGVVRKNPFEKGVLAPDRRVAGGIDGMEFGRWAHLVCKGG